MNDRCKSALRQLRLSGLAETLDVRLQEAAGHQLSHAEFLELILQDELLVRDQRLIGRRVKAAAFRELKPLDEFDLVLQSVDRPKAGLRPGHLPLRARASRRAYCSARRALGKASSSRRSATRRSSRLRRAVSFDLRRGPRLPAGRGRRRARRRCWPGISSPTC